MLLKALSLRMSFWYCASSSINISCTDHLFLLTKPEASTDCTVTFSKDTALAFSDSHSSALNQRTARGCVLPSVAAALSSLPGHSVCVAWHFQTQILRLSVHSVSALLLVSPWQQHPTAWVMLVGPLHPPAAPALHTFLGYTVHMETFGESSDFHWVVNSLSCAWKNFDTDVGQMVNISDPQF